MIKSFLSALFCFLLIIVFFPKNSLAYYYEVPGNGSYSDLTFGIHTFNPEDASKSESPETTGKMTINITARDGAGNEASRFVPGEQYAISIWPSDKSEGACTSFATFGRNSYSAVANPSSNKEVNFNINLKDTSFQSSQCRITPGKWSMTVWLGGEARTSTNTVINPTSIYIDQPGGGVADIQPLDPNPDKNLLCPGKPASFNLLGSKKSQTYSLWWDGDIVRQTQIPGTDQPSSIQNIDTSSRKNPEQYKLCMQPDGLGLPYFRECKRFVVFTKPSDPVKQCAAVSPTCQLTLTTTQAGSADFTANVVGANYTVGNSYRLDVLNRQTGQNVPGLDPKTQNFTPDSSGNINITVGVLPTGTFGVYVYNATGDTARVCGNDNSAVGDQPGALKPPQTTCSSDPRSPNFCASGAGAGCNPSDGTVDTSGTAKGVVTAIGCVPTDPQRLVAGLMKYILGFGGGVALLMMIFGSFSMVTSSGNPDSLKKGREQFVNALIGLLFVVFSTLFMQILGVDILNLPGFTK